MRHVIILAGVAAMGLDAACVNGAWDPEYTWIRDCTPNNPYDGTFDKVQSVSVTGDVKIPVGSARTATLSWRLHYYKSPLSQGVKSDSLPMVVGLHGWTEGATVDRLLNGESGLVTYEGAWEDLIFVGVALENGTNMGTWWDGTKVDGTPISWAMDGIIEMVKARVGDACSKLAEAGVTELQGKVINPNRVYLHGHSMGGTGAYHIGIRHPEVFAAIHAHAGFADYDGGPCGNENFCSVFASNYVGTAAENLQMKGIDGKQYPAKKYSNMSWFVGEHNGASWTAGPGNGKKYEPPYINMTHGQGDATVHMASANRLAEVLKQKRFGYSYNKHTGGHPAGNFLHADWLFGFRKDKSFLALTNNSTDVTSGGAETYNYLNKVGWHSASIIDEQETYQVRLTGMGTVDVTPRRLQKFVITPNAAYRFWVGDFSGDGTSVFADAEGVLTIPKVTVNNITALTIRPEGAASLIQKKNADYGIHRRFFPNRNLKRAIFISPTSLGQGNINVQGRYILSTSP